MKDVPAATSAERSAQSRASESSAIARSVVDLMRNFSIEAIPREVESVIEVAARLPAGTKVYLTRLPKASFDDTLRAAVKLRARGLACVPHLTARTTRDRAELQSHVRALVAEAGVREVLLVAGSQPRPVGEFGSTMEMLATGIFEEAGIERIGVAGHPEGDKQIDPAVLQAALMEKNAFAARTRLELSIVTQFFFDAEPVIRWERRMRELGNRLPIYVGFHGLTGTTGLLRHAIACGIGESIKVLAQHTNVLALAVVRSPERLVVAVAKAAAGDHASCFAGAHFFPLGGFARTAAWAHAVALGDFTLEADGSIHTRDASRVPSP